MVAGHPELADINYLGSGAQDDWTHVNSVAYNEALDQIVISVHNLHEAWVQNFPALGSLVGDNTFTLRAEDITPVPYNQPPYPAAGDTAVSGCTVTGAAP